MRAAVLFWVFAGCAGAPVVDEAGLISMRVGSTNLFVVGPEGDRTLIDAGRAGDEDAIEDALRARGIEMSSIKRVLLTHGHNDHAGAAAALQRRGVPVWGHAHDLARFRSGEDGDSQSFGFEAELVFGFVPHHFPPFEPERLIRGDESRIGELQLTRAGGHTGGSIIIVSGKTALVGDLIRGGFLGGAIAPSAPQLHYFHDDKWRAHRSLRLLLMRHPEVETVWPGHGGPFTRAQLRAYLARQR